MAFMHAKSESPCQTWTCAYFSLESTNNLGNIVSKGSDGASLLSCACRWRICKWH